MLHHIRALSIPILTEEFRLELLEEAQSYPLRYINNSMGRGKNEVRQEMFLQTQLCMNGAFGELVRDFQTLFNDSIAGCDLFDADVVFNDWIIQKYVPGCIGITPHRDRTDYRHMICLFVLSGHGRFHISRDRVKTGSMEVVNLPGDVILMPGPGFKGMSHRPFHYLEDVTTDRWIFGLRHDETRLSGNHDSSG
ncbi:MAG: hypothetical protein OXI60_05780 [Acidiferrobacterales bacterium]|nr:hypothetical protein [Acidiferrobacterales bacterium]